MNVARLSALHTGRLYPQEIFLVLISVRATLGSLNIIKTQAAYRMSVNGHHTHISFIQRSRMYNITKIIQINMKVKVKCY
jgi:hypothetical protein